MNYSYLKKIVTVIIAKATYVVLSKMIKPRQIAIIFSSCSVRFNNLDYLEREFDQRGISFIKLTSDISIKNVYKLAKSRLVLTDQTTPLLSNVTLSKKSKLIQVWHAGGAFKKIGYDAWNGSDEDMKRIKRIHGNTSYIVTSDSKLTNIYASAFHVPQKNVLPFGLLRSDQYFAKQRSRSAAQVILWAPTFRTNSNRIRYCPITAEEVNKLQEKLSEYGLILALRLHPSLQWDPDFKALNWGERELLDCILDSCTVITDYSSIIFDFSLFNGRIFWYIKDKEEFLKERGLYFDPENLLPDFVAHTIDDLIIKVLYNKTENANMIKKEFMSACDGHACDRIIKFIKSL